MVGRWLSSRCCCRSSISLWLAGFFLPFEVARWALAWKLDTSGRLALVVLAVAFLDAGLIRAGIRGQGVRPIVQPWSWGGYGFWPGGRALLLAIAVF